MSETYLKKMKLYQEKAIRDYFEDDYFSQFVAPDAVFKAFEYLAKKETAERIYKFVTTQSTMGSPIEKMFFEACFSVCIFERFGISVSSGSYQFDGIMNPDQKKEHRWPKFPFPIPENSDEFKCDIHDTYLAMEPNFCIVPQFRVGKYRADFLLRYLSDGIIKRDGSEIYQKYRSTVLVECDGFDYHDATKEQATRDKKRDREIKSLGYEVIRFSGSEIHKDPIGCAKEAFTHLIKNAKAYEESDWGLPDPVVERKS